jgi:hypothetical protein
LPFFALVGEGGVVEEVERCLIQPRLSNFALGISHNCLDKVKAVVVLYELEMSERGVEDVNAASVFVIPVVRLVFDVDYGFNEAAVVRDWVEVFKGSFSGHWLVWFSLDIIATHLVRSSVTPRL